MYYQRLTAKYNHCLMGQLRDKARQSVNERKEKGKSPETSGYHHTKSYTFLYFGSTDYWETRFKKRTLTSSVKFKYTCWILAEITFSTQGEFVDGFADDVPFSSLRKNIS